MDINYHPAWRTGIARSLDDCSAVEVTYTHYQGGGDDSLNTEPPLLIRSMVSQPSTWISNSLSDFLHAQATFHVLYDLGDMDYRWTFASSQQYSLTLLGGWRRYCFSNQDFSPSSAPPPWRQCRRTSTSKAAACVSAWKASAMVLWAASPSVCATASFIAGQARST